jgi:hypothetical protein
MKIYKIGLRGDKVRVIDEDGEVAIYPLEYFLVLPLADEILQVIEQHRPKTHEINELILA